MPIKKYWILFAFVIGIFCWHGASKNVLAGCVNTGSCTCWNSLIDCTCATKSTYASCGGASAGSCPGSSVRSKSCASSWSGCTPGSTSACGATCSSSGSWGACPKATSTPKPPTSTPVPVCASGSWCLKTSIGTCASEGYPSGSGNCSNGHCCGNAALTATPVPPTPTATPTPVCGEWGQAACGGVTCATGIARAPNGTCSCEKIDAGNVCNHGSSYCDQTCNQAGGANDGTAHVKCYSSINCVDGGNYCNEVLRLNNTIVCPVDGAAPTSAVCHPLTCESAPSAYCPGFDPSIACGGVGNCDNCGGPSCGSCPGSGAGTPVPTSGSGCTPDCSVASSPCVANTCGTQTCNSNCPGVSCYGTMTGTDPIAPTLASPTNNQVVTSINLQWNALSGVQWGACPLQQKYDLCYGRNSLDPCDVASDGVYVTGTTDINHVVSALASGIWYWKVGANNGNGNIIWSTVWAFSLNQGPVVDSMVYKNSVGTVVAMDTGNKNQICKSGFANDASPRLVTFYFTLSDADGSNDIKTAQMRWNGTITNLVIGTTSAAVSVGASAVVDYTGVGDNNLYVIETRLTDTTSDTGWVASPYTWKVWSCNVSVLGNMYDAADSALGAQCPSGAGYNTPAGSNMNFNYADFTPTVGTAVRIDATTDSAYGSDNVIWGKTYTASPNADITGSVASVRWIDLGVGTTSCGPQLALTESVIDPYTSSSAVLLVDFASTGAQSRWYQVVGGGIEVRGNLSNAIPSTCVYSPSCVPAMSITNNGLITANSITNGGCALGQTGCDYGSPNNWYKELDTLSSLDKYSYQYFYDKYFLSYGYGVTMPANSTMSNVLAVGGTGVVFVNGDLDIDVNNTVNLGNSLIIISKGTINFSDLVTQSAGIFVADGGISTSGAAATALTISGSLYSSSTYGNIAFSRDFTDPLDNNSAPSVVINYRPDLWFNLPGSFLKVLSGWRQN
ncbi:MAG: hypothetical protein WAV41_03700 [Microgenomates group bacterium]